MNDQATRFASKTAELIANIKGSSAVERFMPLRMPIDWAATAHRLSPNTLPNRISPLAADRGTKTTKNTTPAAITKSRVTCEIDVASADRKRSTSRLHRSSGTRRCASRTVRRRRRQPRTRRVQTDVPARSAVGNGVDDAYISMLAEHNVRKRLLRTRSIPGHPQGSAERVSCALRDRLPTAF
jgi:hypothetical protein